MARTRTFTRDQLDALDLPGAWADDAPEILHREQVDSRRWVSVHELIFRAPDDGKAYRVQYEQGLTESQDGTDPWNGDRTVEAVEVEQRTRTVEVTEWHPVDEQPQRPAGLAALLDHVAANLPEEQPTAVEQPRRILTEPEFEATYQAARAELGHHVRRMGSANLSDAIAAALATVGILTPAPEAEPDTCPAMFADPGGTWWQCQQDPGHNPAIGHDSGEWAWPDAEAQQ
jgi:hypothetical protein